MNPERPRRVAHLDTRQQHPIQAHEHGNLDHDREAAAHRVDLFLLVDAHHLLLHFLWLVFQALAHRGDLGADALHLCHAAVGLGVERIEDRLQQHHQRDDGPAPVADQAVQLAQQPVQRLGNDGKDAVVLDQFQTGCQGFELLFFLGAGVQRAVDGLRGARRQLVERQHHGHRIEVVTEGADAEFTLRLGAVGAVQQPGRNEIMLNHGDPAIVGRDRQIGLVLVDVRKVDLVELLFFGIDRWPGKGAGTEHGGRLDRTVAQELQVQLGITRLIAHIDDVVLDVDRIIATLELVCLDVLQAAGNGRLELDFQRVLAVCQFARTGFGCHQRQVIGKLVARIDLVQQAGLRQVTRGRGVVLHQQHAFGAIDLAGKLQQLQVRQRAALAVDIGLEYIGRDADLFTCWHRRALDGHRTGGTGSGAIRRGWQTACAAGRRRARHHCGLVRGQEGRLVAVGHLPLIPQQNHGKTEDHPEDGAADIVHEKGFLSEKREENSEPFLCVSGGTGSCPPLHQGWQRTRRCRVK